MTRLTRMLINVYLTNLQNSGTPSAEINSLFTGFLTALLHFRKIDQHEFDECLIQGQPMARPIPKTSLNDQVQAYILAGGHINIAVNSGKTSTAYEADKCRARMNSARAPKTHFRITQNEQR